MLWCVLYQSQKMCHVMLCILFVDEIGCCMWPLVHQSAVTEQCTFRYISIVPTHELALTFQAGSTVGLKGSGYGRESSR